MSRFFTPLDTRLIDEFDNIHELLAHFVYWSARMQALIVIPKGFKTDFASVPRILLAYLLFGGKGKRAAVIHDGLYTGILAFPCATQAEADALWARLLQGEALEGTLRASRELADQVLGEALIASGYPNWVAGGMYLGVRVGGESRFQQPNVPQTDEVAKMIQPFEVA